MAQVKAVAIAESYNAKGDATVIQCLGAFSSYAEAYGEGMMYLSEFAGEGNTITPLFELEGETGFGFPLKNREGKEFEAVYFLQAKQEDGQEGGT